MRRVLRRLCDGLTVSHCQKLVRHLSSCVARVDPPFRRAFRLSSSWPWPQGILRRHARRIIAGSRTFEVFATLISPRPSQYVETPDSGWWQGLETSHLFRVSTPAVLTYYSSYVLKHHHLVRIKVPALQHQCSLYAHLSCFSGSSALVPARLLRMIFAYLVSSREYLCRFLRVCVAVLGSAMFSNYCVTADVI